MKLLKIETPEVSLEDLDRIERRISMESEHLANFSTTLRAAVPTLVDTASHFLSRFTDRQAPLNKVEAPREITHSDLSSFLQLLEKHKYMTLAEMDFYVPEGFKGHLLDYSFALKASLEHANKVVADVLNPYAMFLSRILTNKDASMRTTEDLGFLAKVDVQRESLIEEMAKFYAKGSTVTKTIVAKVIARNNDWRPLLQTLSQIRLETETLKPEVVQTSVKNVILLLESLKLAVMKGDLDNASGQTLKTLSEATLSAAREVEFYSITHFRAFTLGNVVNENLSTLRTALQSKKAA